MSYSNLGMTGGAVQQLKARTNPLDAFNDVFGGFDGRRYHDAAADPRQAAHRSRLQTTAPKSNSAAVGGATSRWSTVT